jgi:hypothetical protein
MTQRYACLVNIHNILQSLVVNTNQAQIHRWNEDMKRKEN